MKSQLQRDMMRRWVRYLPHPAIPVWQGQLLALGCVVGATGVRFLLDPLVKDRVPFVALFPAVLIASVWGGTLAGASTLVLGALVAAYVWLSPDVPGLGSGSHDLIMGIGGGLHR